VTTARRFPWIMNAFFALIGLIALGAVAHFAGAHSVATTLVASLPWLPLLFVIEGLRIPLEMLVTRRLLGARAREVPLGSLLRAQLVFYAVSICAPGGRLVAEASKASLIGAHVGGMRAAAVATASQAGSLCADALAALLGLVAVFLLSGWSWVTLSLVGFAAASLAASLLLAHVTRRPLPERITSRLGGFGVFLRSLAEAARTERMLRPDIVGLLLIARLCQAVFFGAGLAVVGLAATPIAALAALAFVMVGSLVGEVIPAQLGATDAALLALAPVLNAATAPLATLGVLFHAAQLFWVAVGASAALFARGGRKARSSPQDNESACAASSSTC
jgi:hypothetical protein